MLVPREAVGAVGVPVSAGEARGAFSERSETRLVTSISAIEAIAGSALAPPDLRYWPAVPVASPPKDPDRIDLYFVIGATWRSTSASAADTSCPADNLEICSVVKNFNGLAARMSFARRSTETDFLMVITELGPRGPPRTCKVDAPVLAFAAMNVIIEPVRSEGPSEPLTGVTT